MRCGDVVKGKIKCHYSKIKIKNTVFFINISKGNIMDNIPLKNTSIIDSQERFGGETASVV